MNDLFAGPFGASDTSNSGFSSAMPDLFGEGVPSVATAPPASGIPDLFGAEAQTFAGKAEAAERGPTQYPDYYTRGMIRQQAVLPHPVEGAEMSPEEIRDERLRAAGVNVDYRGGIAGYVLSSAHNLLAGTVKGAVDFVHDTAQYLGADESILLDEWSKELGKPMRQHQFQQAANMQKALEEHGVMGRTGVMVAQTATDLVLFLVMIRYMHLSKLGPGWLG